ncbi:hypothetical protein [Candidatus Uabimicrobium amorphum]|uniref:Uncharacterized protein n=1 Tax=Uabimicrobium amorphum TaxID=2596890 RepID=A0A5S9IUC3_UABAM|nr:hypothetical protein [Candidatus Uabimicrobium amorphum]BBM88094.1 hypothetical protein UABAM_06510 [Candidatus Uabimicrobium amorphum]
MKKICLFLVVLCCICADKYPPYEDIADNAAKYYKKNVAFTFGFAGVRSKVSGAMKRRGFRDSQYSQLYANDVKLALLITKNGSAWRTIESMSKGTKLLCSGKVKRLNARSGGDFYYLEIAAIKQLESEEDSTSEQETTIEAIAKSPEEFVDREIETKDTFIRIVNFQKIDREKYKRVQCTSKMIIVFPNSNKSIENALRKISKRTPIRIFGSIKEVKIKKKDRHVLIVSKIESTIKAIENKALPKNEFRRRGRRRGRN